jgi:Icc protein
MTTADSLRVLQITDLHILPRVRSAIYGTDSFESLRAVLGAALVLPEPPTLVVATGDLAEDGSEESYDRLRGPLLETGLPFYVLPGNHDSEDEMRSALVGGPIQTGPVVDIGSWRLVLLDSCVRGAPHGFLAASQLDLLTSALADDPSRPVLTCLHHGPARPCPASGCRLHNDDVLLGLLGSRPNARAVISGHAHTEIERHSEHVTLLTAPSTCSQGIHAQRGEPVDHEDFWASHRFDPSRYGFRMLTLLPGGELESAVHWVPSAPLPDRLSSLGPIR